MPMENDGFVYDITDDEIIKSSEPINDDEKTLLNILLTTFGDFASIPEISETLKISRTYLYRAKNQRKFVTYSVGGRKVVLTKILINFIRTFEEDE